jgi:hypothetical protein
MCARNPVLLFLATLILGAAIDAHAATTWWVANDGTDSSSCGDRAKPCRSISQAIENASPSDTIAVGAGRYGDISGDGTFSHPGDEHPKLIPNVYAPLFESQGCIVCVTKPLRILSLHGASVTVIEGKPNTPYDHTVLIASDGVLFGNTGQGFTITGGNSNGVAIMQSSLQESGKRIVIAGNRDSGDSFGFRIEGRIFQDRQCPVPEACPPEPIQLTNNEAIGNPGAGFVVIVNAFDSSAPTVLQGNTARDGGTGFSIQPGGQNELAEGGSAGAVTLTDNVALHNVLGFDANSVGPMNGNTAAGNQQAGFQLVPAFASFQGNSAIGNAGPGVIVNFSTDGFDFGDELVKVFRPFRGNNFYGNDRSRPPLLLTVLYSNGSGLNPGPSAHCGVLNVGALGADYGAPSVYPIGSAPPQHLDASGNFWGSADGPSATGPGDAAGGVCDQNNGTTVSKPFAKEGVGITTAPTL